MKLNVAKWLIIQLKSSKPTALSHAFWWHRLPLVQFVLSFECGLESWRSLSSCKLPSIGSRTLYLMSPWVQPVSDSVQKNIPLACHSIATVQKDKVSLNSPSSAGWLGWTQRIAWPKQETSASVVCRLAGCSIRLHIPPPLPPTTTPRLPRQRFPLVLPTHFHESVFLVESETCSDPESGEIFLLQ